MTVPIFTFEVVVLDKLLSPTTSNVVYSVALLIKLPNTTKFPSMNTLDFVESPWVRSVTWPTTIFPEVASDTPDRGVVLIPTDLVPGLTSITFPALKLPLTTASPALNLVPSMTTLPLLPCVILKSLLVLACIVLPINWNPVLAFTDPVGFNSNVPVLLLSRVTVIGLENAVLPLITPTGEILKLPNWLVCITRKSPVTFTPSVCTCLAIR